MSSLLKLFREPINSLTHWFGALKALVFLGILLALALQAGVNPAPFLIFGLSMFALYVASASYHSFRVTEKALTWLRKLDHSAIFLLIAGSYTPILLFSLDGVWRIAMMSVVWSLALVGITLKLITLKMPRWISTTIYLAMGWMALIIVPQLLHLPMVFTWLLIGGVLYTIGGIIYGTKRLNPVPGFFGFHEIWHLFVLGGTTAHFIMMLYLLPNRLA